MTAMNIESSFKYPLSLYPCKKLAKTTITVHFKDIQNNFRLKMSEPRFQKCSISTDMFPSHEDGRMKQLLVVSLGTFVLVHLSAGSCWPMTLIVIVEWNGHLRIASYIQGLSATRKEM